MTLELGLAAVFAFVAVVCGALGFGGARSRTAVVARGLFYMAAAVIAVSLVVGLLGLLGVGRFI